MIRRIEIRRVYSRDPIPTFVVAAVYEDGAVKSHSHAMDTIADVQAFCERRYSLSGGRWVLSGAGWYATWKPESGK